MPDFAPGIPANKIKHPIPITGGKYWNYVLQRHYADKAGLHYDLRLSDGKHAYSWSLRKGIPEPGTRHLAVRQFDHRPSYMKFQGDIDKGYGKGKVEIVGTGKMRLVQSEPNKINFVLLDKKDPEKLSLIRTDGNKWLIINNTPTRYTHPDVPLYKPKYRETDVKESAKYLDDDNWVMQPKIDGAHVIVKLGDHPEIYSYRESKRSNRLLNHTYRFENIEKVQVPNELRNSIFRGEVFATDKDGKALPVNELGALLNSSPENSLAQQKLLGLKFRVMLFDPHKIKNENVSELPYKDKLKHLQNAQALLQNKYIDIFAPPTAITKDEKAKMWTDISNGLYPETKEGAVAWNLNENGGTPTKLQIRPDYDVYVKEIVPISKGEQTGKSAGGFKYSLTPEGPVVGHVGTGFSKQLRDEMWNKQDQFVGRAAKIHALDQFPSGAYRAPAFLDWHIEKGEQPEVQFNKVAFIEGLLNGLKIDIL